MSAKQKKAAKKVAAKKAEKEPRVGVMATLAAIFSRVTVGTDEQIITEVAKETGRAALKVSTLRLYKAKWRAGGFPEQKGKHGTLNQPSEPKPEKKEKGKKGMTASVAKEKAKAAGAKAGKDAKAQELDAAEVKAAIREAEDKALDELGFVRTESGAVKPKA